MKIEHVFEILYWCINNYISSICIGQKWSHSTVIRRLFCYNTSWYPSLRIWHRERRRISRVFGCLQGRTQAYVCTQKRPHRFRKKKERNKKKERKKKRNGRERAKAQFSYSRIVNNIAYRSASIVTVRWPMSRIVCRTLHGVGLYYVGPTCTLPQRT